MTAFKYTIIRMPGCTAATADLGKLVGVLLRKQDMATTATISVSCAALEKESKKNNRNETALKPVQSVSWGRNGLTIQRSYSWIYAAQRSLGVSTTRETASPRHIAFGPCC